jgi:hypothetical protein
MEAIRGFLKQRTHENSSLTDTLAALEKLVGAPQ